MPTTTTQTDPFARAIHALLMLSLGASVIFICGLGIALFVRYGDRRWTWTLLLAPIVPISFAIGTLTGIAVLTVFALACVLGARWHSTQIQRGGEIAAKANARPGLRRTVQHRRIRRDAAQEGFLSANRLTIGEDEHGLPVRVPVGLHSGLHSLILGATGAGKSVTMAWITALMIRHGCGAVVVDPKGDAALEATLRRAAEQAGREFERWTPEGPLAYNPYAHGDDTEIADKALAGEQFTEPHYLRLGQRYLGHATRTMRAARIPITPITLMAHMDVAQLEETSRKLDTDQAAPVQRYLDSLSDRQRRDLAGIRDRLSILAESKLGKWLDPDAADKTIDLRESVIRRRVVYFRLDADRHAQLTQMLAAAIIGDLVTISAGLQQNPIPTLVAIDEFAATAGQDVARLFGRARSAGISLLLATQSLADLAAVGDGALQDQVLDNLKTAIVHRQNVPGSAELIAGFAGTKEDWIKTRQTDAFGETGQGSRRRGREYIVHPDQIKQLPDGQALVITKNNQPPTIAHIHHPRDLDHLDRDDANDWRQTGA